jgi:hypothetical protein
MPNTVMLASGEEAEVLDTNALQLASGVKVSANGRTAEQLANLDWSTITSQISSLAESVRAVIPGSGTDQQCVLIKLPDGGTVRICPWGTGPTFPDPPIEPIATS